MSKEEDAIFVRNFSMVLVFLVVIGIVAFILAKLVNSNFQKTQNNETVIAERLAPVGNINVGEPFIASAGGESGEPTQTETDTAVAEAAPADPGKATYGKICFACHDAGVGGAPKLGDAAAWADRTDKGTEMLTTNAINGFTGTLGIMPPKGGLPSLTDDEVTAAVDYMLAALEAGDAAAASSEPATSAAPELTADDVDGTAVADGRGKEVYDSACFICHATGVAGAPKIGDSSGWSPRVAQGTELLYTHAIKGYMGEAGLMPPKGGRMDYSDEDVKAAVDYMVTNSQ